LKAMLLVTLRLGVVAMLEPTYSGVRP
jgi:hypothetical protein